VVETDWPLEKICSIQLPNDEKWDGNDHLWADILNGIHLNED